MSDRKEIKDNQGRTWTVARFQWDQAEEEDFRFWYEGLSGEDRVKAVAEALVDCLKTRGINVVPRLRRVHRRVKCPWRAVSGGRRTRGRVSRASSRHKGP